MYRTPLISQCKMNILMFSISHCNRINLARSNNKPKIQVESIIFMLTLNAYRKHIGTGHNLYNDSRFCITAYGEILPVVYKTSFYRININSQPTICSNLHWFMVQNLILNIKTIKNMRNHLRWIHGLSCWIAFRMFFFTDKPTSLAKQRDNPKPDNTVLNQLRPAHQLRLT